MERIGWAGWAAASIALAFLGTAGVAEARKGDTRTTIFIGQTTYTDGTATTIGTSVGVRWGLEFADDLLWTIGGDYSATEGQRTENNQTFDIEARTTTVRTGLTYLFNNEPQSAIIPFVGAGLSVIQYDIDYTYPGSEVDETSGFGPGPFALGGAEIRLTRNIHFIPQYVYSAHIIETEDGDSFTLISQGLVLALRIAF